MIACLPTNPTSGLPARSNVKPPSERYHLNTQRPSNPFAPSLEPDWKESPRAPPTHPGSTMNADPRNLSALGGRQSYPLEADSNTKLGLSSNHALSPRTHDQPGTISGSKSVARKPAPPVPKKPTLLTKHGGQQATNESNIPGEEIPESSVSRAERRARIGVTKVGDLAGEPMTSESSQGHQQSMTEVDNLPLPTRRRVTATSKPGGLMDDDDDRAIGIPPLQPVRKT